MGFLDQLKSQATDLKKQQSATAVDLVANASHTESACLVVLYYFRDLAKHLTIIEPSAHRFSLDGKTPWPAMKLIQFSTDARKKKLRDKEVFDTLSLGWTITPKLGVPVGGAVTLTLLPDAERVQQALNQAHVSYERKEHRHPERKSPPSVRFEYTTLAKGNITVRADHDASQLVFRLANVDAFGIRTHAIDAARVNTAPMDELAKLIVAQTSNFA